MANQAPVTDIYMSIWIKYYLPLIQQSNIKFKALCWAAQYQAILLDSEIRCGVCYIILFMYIQKKETEQAEKIKAL